MSQFWHQLTFLPLKWIWFGGLHPSYNSKFANFHFCFNFAYYCLILVLAVIEIWVSLEDNVFDAIESVLTIFLYLHILGKYTILHLHKSTLSRLLEERVKFWEIEEVDEKTKEECFNTVNNARLVIKGYLTYSCLVASSFLVQPFITGQLPVLLYVPEGWYYFLEISFWYLTPSILASIWGVDTTFYSISQPVIVQFKLLAYKFENLYLKIDGADNEALDKVHKEMTKLVDYHNFLIWYSTEINRMFSGIFLIQFLVAIATSCMQLFIATEGRFDLGNKFKCLSYFIMQIIETAIYCFTTESITANSQNIGNAIYKSNWYNLPANSIKKDVTIIINRAQKPVVFSGFELVSINKESFTRIFKTALSFYTYLNTMVYND